MNKEKFWGYIGGIIDGEGCISDPQTRPTGNIVIVNADKQLLVRIKIFLDKNNVKSAIYKRKTKQKSYHSDSFQLQINGWRNLKTIFNNCPVFIKKKHDQLQFIIQRGEMKERKKQNRISNFVKLKSKHPEYSLSKVARILNENLSNILYRWGVLENPKIKTNL